MDAVRLSITRRMVLEDLRTLSDLEYQERVWVRGEGPEVSSYVETVCGLFDDSGLGDLFELDEGVFGPEADSELRRLHTLLHSMPDDLSHAERLRHPLWRDVIGCAARAATLVSTVASE